MSTMSPNKKIVLVLSLLVLLLVFFGASALYYRQSRDTHEGGVSYWTIYENPEYGFSVQYPPEFELGREEDTTLITFPLEKYFHTHLIRDARIEIDSPRDICLDKYDGALSAQSVVINGVEFNRIVSVGVGTGNLYEGIDYTTRKNGLCYRIGLFVHSTNGEGFYSNDPTQIAAVDSQHKADTEAVISIFDGIMSTFRPL